MDTPSPGGTGNSTAMHISENIPDWRSCCYPERLDLFLVTYVDDFKLSGPATMIKEGWHLICKGIRTDDPTHFGLYLGCYH